MGNETSEVTRTPMSLTAPAIQVGQLSFRYRDTGQKVRPWTLNNLTFDVGVGQIFGIVGPNGSGKSSLLKVLSGLMTPETGAIRLSGAPIAQLSQRDIARIVAVVPQDYVHVFPFTVAETVLMGRFPHRPLRLWSLGVGDETQEDLSCAHQAMTDTDVWSLADRLVSDLSGGERQRVMIARALAQEPAILLMDEPTAFLDINHQIDICALISRLRSERRLTVVLVSHDLNVASQYCDRVMMLKDGSVFQIGSPSDVMRPNVLREVYGCPVLIDSHPDSGRPRVTLPGMQSRG